MSDVPRARRRRWPTPTSGPASPSAAGRRRWRASPRPELGRWTTEQKVELALAAERAARAHEGVTQVESTVYSDSEASVALSNSRGFSGAFDATQAWTYASAFAGEGRDLMTGLGVALGRDPAALDPEAIGAEAAERALALVGARQPESRRCPVVLDAFVAASFVAFIGAMLSADAVQRGRSLFAGREGEEVARPGARAGGRRHRPRGPGQRAVRRRGLAHAGGRRWCEGGRLLTFLFDVRTARRAGREHHGQRGARLLPLAAVGGHLEPDRRVPARETWPSSFGDAGDGLYVTDVAGLHSGVNPVSGTFSVGASGRLIEDGELGAPVREMTIASDLVTMLRGVSGVGSESRWIPLAGSVKTPPF